MKESALEGHSRCSQSSNYPEAGEDDKRLGRTAFTFNDLKLHAEHKEGHQTSNKI